jgi:hypothetical protein
VIQVTREGAGKAKAGGAPRPRYAGFQTWGICGITPDILVQELAAVVTAGLYASRTQMPAALEILNRSILPAAAKAAQ